jgi:single-stranded-DNA-specific exonuclease
VLTAVGDVLIRFGGHQAAAGLEVSINRLDELRERFESACAATGADAAVAGRELGLVLELHPEDEPAQVLSDLGRLEPCGAGNPAPRLAVAATIGSARAVRGGHLKLELVLDGGRRLSGFGPNLGERAEALAGEVRAVGRLRTDRWRGGNAVEMLVEQLV